MSRKLGRNEIEEEYDKMIKVYYKQVWKHCNEATLYNSYRLIKWIDFISEIECDFAMSLYNTSHIVQSSSFSFILNVK